MTVKVIVELEPRDGKTDEIINLFRKIFPSTRKYDVCKQIDVSIGTHDTTNIVITEEWETKEKHQNYVLFRTDDGTNAKIGALLAAKPKMQYYDLTGA